MSINLAKGFRRLTLIVSLALFLALLLLNGFYLKHFYYYNSSAPNWNEPGYKLYLKLQDRVIAAVDSGFMTDERGRAILDESTAPLDTAAKRVRLVRYKDLTAAEKAEVEEEPPFPPGAILIEPPPPTRSLVILSLLKGMTLPPKRVVPRYQRVEWSDLALSAGVSAVPWLVYGVGLYIGRGFFGL